MKFKRKNVSILPLQYHLKDQEYSVHFLFLIQKVLMSLKEENKYENVVFNSLLFELDIV